MASLPPGFVMEGAPAPRRRSSTASRAPIPFAPGAIPHDGDTFPLGGSNARLFGADAFELSQPGFVGNQPVPLGQAARGAFSTTIAPGGVATPTGSASYGRPVVSVNVGGRDAGRDLIASGHALPTPNFLAADPKRSGDYIAAQREAIAAERGAYAGQYQNPTDYRRKGVDAPWQGRTPMTPAQAKRYGGMMFRNDTRPADLERWAASQGQPMANAGNLLELSRRTPTASLTPVFQQRDVTGSPVLRDGPGVVQRVVGAFNEGLLADTLGAPVDLVNGAMGALGVPVSDKPFMGSRFISDQAHRLGIGQVDDSYAARSDAERYAQSIARGVGQVALPVAGSLSAGARLAASTAPMALRASGSVVNGLRSMAAEAFARPGVTIAGEVAGGVGAGLGGQAARDAFPGNAYADLAGQVLGGVGAGLGGGAAAARYGRTPSPLPSGPLLDGAAPAPAPVAADALPSRLDDATYQARAQAMFDAGASADELRRFATDAGGYSLSGVDEAVAYRNAGGKGARVAGVQRPGVGQDAAIPDGFVLESDLSGKKGSPADAPEARAIGAASIPSGTGPHGPIHPGLSTNYPAALSRLRADQAGEVPGAIRHPDLGPIDLVWGDERYGLAKIERKHPEVLDDLPSIVEGLPVRQVPSETGNNRFVLEDDRHRAIVAPDYLGDPKRWLVTAFERKGAPGGQTSRRDPLLPGGVSPGSTLPDNMGGSSFGGNPPTIGFRQVDRLDMADVVLPPGYEWETPVGGFSRGAGESASPAQMAAMARGAQPADFQRLPSSVIGSLDEAVTANPGTLRDVVAPDPRDALPSYRVGTTNRREPLDLVSWLRTKGGVRDDTGDLAAMGVGNAARDFDRGEGFLGRLVHDRGMSLDDAAEAATSAGFFAERPDINELLAAIDDTHRGTNRLYHPDDLNTVDAYERAVTERDFVNQARDEGAPLATDVGQPVTLDDLDANAAPATAYEDLDRATGGKVGNIRIDKLNTPQDISRALAATDYRAGGFDAARRGVVSQGETAQLARELGMTADDLLKRRRGQALNAEQALAARAILAKSGDELTTIAGRAVGGSDADKVAFRQAWLRHVAIQEQVSGATAEAGRALAQFRMTASSRDAQGRVLKAMVEAGGGDNLEKVAEAILELRDPAKRNKFLRDASKPRFSDKLSELYYNSLLSGPQTHVTNMLSNTMTAIGQIPEHAVAAGIGLARRAVRLGDEDRVLASEVGSRAVGLVQGFREGLAQFARTIRTGQPSDFLSKVEATQQEAISGLKGKIIRTPSRALAAEDELFKAIARRMELAGLATRQAFREGLKGVDAKRRAGDLLANPTDDMLEKAFDYGRYVTFQRPLGEIGQSASRFSNSTIAGLPLPKLILPFVRTPTNILKFALERSPAAPLLDEWRADVAAGGARRDLAVARASIGAAVGVMAMQMAMSGQITGGGPADKATERLMLADGWQPYSVRIGDRWVSYQRLDPFSTTLGVAADMVDLQEAMTDSQREQVAGLLVSSVMQNLKDKTWLNGLSDFIHAIEDPGRSGSSFTASMAGSLAVPGIVAQTARTVDPFLREAREPMDRIRSRLPFASTGLEPRRDIWGAPIRNEGGFGPDMLSPLWESTARNDPTNRALIETQTRIGVPSRRVGGQELSAREYGAYRAAIGAQAKPTLDALTASPIWRGMDDEERQDTVDRVMREARKSARASMFGGRGTSRRRAPAPIPAAGSGLPPGFVMER